MGQKQEDEKQKGRTEAGQKGKRERDEMEKGGMKVD